MVFCTNLRLEGRALASKRRGQAQARDPKIDSSQRKKDPFGVKFVVFFIAFLQSCYHPSPHEAFDDMKAIEGKWVSAGPTLFNENWQVVSDTLMRGIGFSMNGKDTVFKEDLKLVRKADTIWMAIQTDPEEGFVFFKMVEAGRGKWTFKNPENEYPAIIRYHLKKDTVLEAGIANIRGNKEVIFKFKKMLP